MKRMSLSLWGTRLAWTLLAFDLLLIFAVPADADLGSLVLLLAYAGWLLASLVLASAWLLIRYRKLFRAWWGWLIPVLCLFLSSMVSQNILSVGNPNLSFFFALLFIVSGCCVGVATAILLWYRDVSLSLMAWGTVIVMWALVFAWRFQGNLIELSLQSLAHPDEPSALWWFNSLLCLGGWIFPLGVVSFLAHTVRLILRNGSTPISRQERKDLAHEQIAPTAAPMREKSDDARGSSIPR